MRRDTGLSHISHTDLDTLLFTPSLHHAKNLQGEVAQNVVMPVEKDVLLRTFGGMIVKTEPVKYLGRAELAHIPLEYKEIILEDTHFYRLHFLPMGVFSAEGLTESLKLLYLGVCDLQEFTEWLKNEQIRHKNRLAGRFLFGFSDYALGRVIKKHLKVFEILEESPPLDPRVGWQRALLSAQAALNQPHFFSPYVAIGAFVPGFLLQSERLPFQKERLKKLLLARSPDLEKFSDDQLELQLRRSAILRASGITR